MTGSGPEMMQEQKEQDIGSVGQWGMREKRQRLAWAGGTLGLGCRLMTRIPVLDIHLVAGYCLARLEVAGMEFSKVRAW